MALATSILKSGTRASQPAAAAANNGVYYRVTDEGNIVEQSTGAAWVAIQAGGGANAVTAAGTLTSGQPVLGGGSKAAAVGPINLAGGSSFVTGDLPYANLAQGSALSVLGVTGNATADVASMAAGSDHQVLRRSGTSVAFGALNLAQSAAVTGVLPNANGGTTILRATYTLNNAEIIALPSASIQLVAAPASGSQINFISGYLSAKFTSGAYTGASTTNSWLALAWGGTTQVASSYVANDSTITPTLTYLTSLLSAANSVVALGPWQDTAIETQQWGTLGPRVPSASVDAVNLALTVSNGPGNFGGGHAANTLKVVVFYTIESLA